MQQGWCPVCRAPIESVENCVVLPTVDESVAVGGIVLPEDEGQPIESITADANDETETELEAKRDIGHREWKVGGGEAASPPMKGFKRVNIGGSSGRGGDGEDCPDDQTGRCSAGTSFGRIDLSEVSY